MGRKEASNSDGRVPETKVSGSTKFCSKRKDLEEGLQTCFEYQREEVEAEVEEKRNVVTVMRETELVIENR